MFKKFKKFFNFEHAESVNQTQTIALNITQQKTHGFFELLNAYEGNSFGNGVYRLHEYKNIEKWNEIILSGFPEFRNRIACFGYDWLGRQFSLDNERIYKGEPQILMFEPGTGEVLEIACNFLDFHEKEIPKNHSACLASEFFQDWITNNPERLKNNECVGYKTPLFLGGEDNISNLEKCDLEVYWSINAQLIQKIKDLPEGTPIDRFDIS